MNGRTTKRAVQNAAPEMKGNRVITSGVVEERTRHTATLISVLKEWQSCRKRDLTTRDRCTFLQHSTHARSYSLLLVGIAYENRQEQFEKFDQFDEA